MATWINQNLIVRRVVLAIAIWMTWAVSRWSMEFALASKLPGTDVAAVIAAIQLPVTLFTGSVFKAYVEGRAQ